MHNLIHEWKVENKLNKYVLYAPLLEGYRRLNMFNKNDLGSKLLVLALPSFMKSAINAGYFVCASTETPRVNNWYKLTRKGKIAMCDLINSIHWDEKNMNEYLFNF